MGIISAAINFCVSSVNEKDDGAVMMGTIMMMVPGDSQVSYRAHGDSCIT